MNFTEFFITIWIYKKFKDLIPYSPKKPPLLDSLVGMEGTLAVIGSIHADTNKVAGGVDEGERGAGRAWMFYWVD